MKKLITILFIFISGVLLSQESNYAPGTNCIINNYSITILEDGVPNSDMSSAGEWWGGGVQIKEVGTLGSITETMPDLQNSSKEVFTTYSVGSGVYGWTARLDFQVFNDIWYFRGYVINQLNDTAYSNVILKDVNSGAPATAPVIANTRIPFDIQQTTEESGGVISSDGGASITAKGVVWSSSTSTPTITVKDGITDDGTGVADYYSSLTGLSTGTGYWVRAYATNSVNTSYGNSIAFTTKSAATTFSINHIATSAALSEITSVFRSIHFNSAGTKMYAVGNSGNTHQYSLSTAWLITTLSFDNVTHNPSEISSNVIFSTEISSNDENLYLLNNIQQKVYQYIMTTPGDLSTAPSTANYIKSITRSYSRITANTGTNFTFSDFAGASNLRNYTLSTSYRISTLTETSTDTKAINNAEFDYGTSGEYLYVSIGDSLQQFDIDIPYIGTSAGNKQTDDLNGHAGGGYFITVEDNSSRVYFINPSDLKVYQYDIINN